MSLRTKFFIIVGVVIAFIVFIILIFSKNGGDVASVVSPSVSSFPAPPIGSSMQKKGSISTESSPATKETSIFNGERQLEALMQSFAERFGSFSNQSDFENIRQLQSLMTPTMQEWSKKFIADAKAKSDASAPYYGITTRAFNVSITGMDDSGEETRATVKTQRREVKGRSAPRVFYQDLMLALKKIDGGWKVESAIWR